MSDLHSLVDQGIVYEDDFVEMYFKVLRDEGFMDFFGPHQEEARGLLTHMIEESQGHKAILEELKTKL